LAALLLAAIARFLAFAGGAALALLALGSAGAYLKAQAQS
jgi:hypothetical protein